MSLAVVNSRAQVGLEAPPVTVEVHLSPGLPALNIVGLPEMEVKEAKDRVRSAILNAHFDFPARRITVNLAPADLPKEGGRFDLPMAIGILAASGQIPNGMLAQHEFVGELALSGELRAVRGALSVALAAARERRALILPLANVDEASLIRRQTLLPAEHLLQVTAHLCGGKPLTAVNGSDRPVDSIVPGGPICWTSRDSVRPSAPWRSPRPAPTACCWWARPAPARVCWPRACRDCCRR